MKDLILAILWSVILIMDIIAIHRGMTPNWISMITAHSILIIVYFTNYLKEKYLK